MIRVNTSLRLEQSKFEGFLIDLLNNLVHCYYASRGDH